MLLNRRQFGLSALLLIFTFNTGILFAQNRTSDLSANVASASDRNILEDRSSWQEIISERTEFSSSYKTADGRYIQYHSKQLVNYFKDGSLVPVDFKPTFSSRGLTASHQPHEISVLNNGAVEINSFDNSVLTFSENTTINGVKVSPNRMEASEQFASMSTGIPGIKKTFEFRFNGVKYNYVLQTPYSSSTDLTIEEEITMPKNSKLVPDANYGRQDERGWLGPMQIFSENGKELGTIRGALCFDANKNYVTAAYKTEVVNGKQKIKIIVPHAWLADASRVYPITIDPLVTGPTVTYTGTYIPSCIAPASASDSILATIPAQVSVTGCFVSGSFYASPFTSAIMNDGLMFFSTSCGTSANFTTSGTAGMTAGTAYLSAYDLKSPLLCCKPQSCSAQTIYISMHVSRTGPGTGCNSSYIYHDPFGGYPFSCYIEGHTVENYGPMWIVSPNTICSDVCTVTGTVYIRYGVPPFTITHPWMTGTITTGTPAGCSTASVPKALTLNIPGCPWTCDTISSLSVPPPTVTDACGNTITGTPPKVITIKEVPEVVASPNPITICSGETFNATLTPCLGTSVVSWNGNGTSGTGTSIAHTLFNTTTSVSSTNYQVYAVNNTCMSDTITLVVNTDPLPVAAFSPAPQPSVINTPTVFNDLSSVYGGTTSNWYWSFGDGSFDFTPNPTHTYAIPGIYTACLAMQTSDGCVDTVCQDVTVIPAEMILPNVITPNGDNSNEMLYFKYLEFFGNNNLKIFDRWGQMIYQKENYTNDWIPSSISDGTYYYVLTVESGDMYPGFVQVITSK